MPYHQDRRIIYAMHSSHEKFKDIRYDMKLQSTREGSGGVPYMSIRDGKLTEVQKEFLFKVVAKDFNNPKNGYGKIFIDTWNPDKIEFNTLDLKSAAERVFALHPFKTIFVDHCGLMSSRNKYQSTTERLNEVFRDLKLLSMQFNRGAGIAVVGLHQLSREGFKAAVKRKEKSGRAEYMLTDLSYANEAEKSADYVTTSFIDQDLRNRQRVQFQALKGRDNDLFETFYARFDAPFRRLLACFDMEMGDKTAQDIGDQIDKLDL